MHCTGVVESLGKIVLLRGGMAAPDRDDDELLLLTRGGKPEAFDVLVRRHQLRALRIARKYLGDTAAAKDVVQAAFLDVYRALPRYQPRGQFAAYFHRVLLNQCHMAHRSRKYVRRTTVDARGGEPEHAPASEELVLAREKRAAVERAVGQLSRKLRDVIVLRFAGDLAYEEIATVLELPLGTIKSRLSAGLEQLRRLLEEEP